MTVVLTRRTFGVLGAALIAAGCTTNHPALARTGPDSFAPLIRRVLPAVVNIAVTETVQSGGDDVFSMLPPELQRQFRDRFRARRRQQQGAGSGFIIDPSGYIVTNNHVVGHADEITVALSNGTELPARLVGIDELTDIAVIKVSASGSLPYVSFGESRNLQVGDWVLAAGNPFGLGGSVSAGIVSALGRDIGSGPFDDFIQIDAPVNPGNSGGPVFDEDGNVVGVTTAIASPSGGSVGIGFAIPSELASHVVAELRDKGRIERGWLGVALAEVEGADGVVISQVTPGGPAARAGLRRGDQVLAVNGDQVGNVRALTKTVAGLPPGSAVRLAVRRQGRDLGISVTIGRRPNEEG